MNPTTVYVGHFEGKEVILKLFSQQYPSEATQRS
jgi:hypothetical protein